MIVIVLAHDRFVKLVIQAGILVDFEDFFDRRFFDFALYSYEE